jgi:hypothetical protein
MVNELVSLATASLLARDEWHDDAFQRDFGSVLAGLCSAGCCAFVAVLRPGDRGRVACRYVCGQSGVEDSHVRLDLAREALVEYPGNRLDRSRPTEPASVDEVRQIVE